MADHKQSIVLAAISLRKSLFNIYYLEESSDEEEEEKELLTMVVNYVNKDFRKPPRITNYFEEVIPNYNTKEFQSHFRLTVAAFEALVNKVSPLLKNNNNIGRPTNEPRKQLLAFLWLLATPDSYRSVGDRFNFGKSTLTDIFKRIINILNTIASTIIKWPAEHTRQQIKQKFSRFARLNNVIGAIDGTYTPIKAPQIDPEVYITRKCFHGMTLQAISDADLKFTDCYIAYPGSVSDTRIFRNSHIFNDISQNPHHYFGNESFIIGDKASPVLKWCIPPYIERRRLNAVERNFNKVQAKTRQCVERTFALLFGRFRRLKYLDMSRTDLIPATVISCCVLHNLCLSFDDLLVEHFIEEAIAFVRENNYEVDEPHEAYVNGNNEGEERRRNIALELPLI